MHAKRIWIALVCAALLVASAAHGDVRPSQNRGLTLGLLVSLSGSGGSTGTQQVYAAELAVSQINAQGGVGGAPIKLVTLDDGSDAKTAVDAMRELIQTDGAVAVLGPGHSNTAVAADPLANRLRTPVLGISNTASRLVGTCDFPCRWNWRDSLGDATIIPDGVKWFVDRRQPATAAIVYSTPDHLGVDQANVARRSLKANGVRVSISAAASPVGSPSHAVAAALATGPDVVFVATTFAGFAAEVMRDARREGFKGTFIGGNTFNGATVAQLAGGAGAGALSGAAWYAGNDFPANVRFVNAFRHAFRGETPDEYAAQAYTGVQILAAALRDGRVAAPGLTLRQQRDRVQAALADVTLLTPLGPFRFTPEHDVSQVVWIEAMDGKGSYRLVGFCDPGC